MHDNKPSLTWVLNVDESANAQGSGAKIVLRTPDGTIIEHSLRF